MRRLGPTLVSLALAMCMTSATAVAADWYVHRTSHQIDQPPWYCYCYRIASDSILPGTDSYPMDMQVPLELAQSRVAGYLALSDTCSANCGIPADGMGAGNTQAVHPLVGQWRIVQARGAEGATISPPNWLLRFDAGGTFSAEIDGNSSGGGWRPDGPSRVVMNSTADGTQVGVQFTFGQGGRVLVIRYDDGAEITLERL